MCLPAEEIVNGDVVPDRGDRRLSNSPSRSSTWRPELSVVVFASSAVVRTTSISPPARMSPMGHGIITALCAVRAFDFLVAEAAGTGKAKTGLQD